MNYVFLRFKCQNRINSNVFFIANEWTLTHVDQTKKLSKQTGPTCWSDLLDNIGILRGCLSNIFFTFSVMSQEVFVV